MHKSDYTMEKIEERCMAIPGEYRTADYEQQINLRLELMSYVDYKPEAVKACWEELRMYDNRIRLTSPSEAA